MSIALTLRTRLAIGALGMALVLAAPLVIAVRALRQVHVITLDLRYGAFAASLLLGRLREGTDNLRRAEDALLFVHDSTSRIRMAGELASLRAMADSLDQYALSGPATQVRLALDSLAVLTDEEYARATAGSGTAAAEIVSSQWVRPRIGTIDGTIAAAEQALRIRTRDRVDDATNATEAAERAAVLALVVALAFASIIAVWLIRSISRPVHDLEIGMRAVAGGHFDHRLRIAPHRRDEFGRLAASFTSMANRLADLDRLKAEFISVASHELKTPINVILGYVELLQDGIYGRPTDQQREVLGTVAAQARNLTRLVRRLLDVSRFEAGGGRLDFRQVDLGRFLTALESSFTVLALQREVHFQVTRGDGLPAEVRWDEDRINEVLGNLLSNAFKFTPRGGNVELRATAEPQTIRLVVADTGAGIPPDQLPHVFQKFFQADNQAKAAVKGTGLGLAIAKEIVEAHGGAITVESAPGQGTRFTIVLPDKADVRRSGEHRRRRSAA